MPYWYTREEWELQFPKEFVYRADMTWENIRKSDSKDERMKYCPSWVAPKKKGRPKKEVRKLGIADHVQQAAAKRRRKSKPVAVRAAERTAAAKDVVAVIAVIASIDLHLPRCSARTPGASREVLVCLPHPTPSGDRALLPRSRLCRWAMCPHRSRGLQTGMLFFSCGFDVKDGYNSMTCPMQWRKPNHQVGYTRKIPRGMQHMDRAQKDSTRRNFPKQIILGVIKVTFDREGQRQHK
jgi:hypothetical protein